MGRDWADTEDHDFLNEFVGSRIDAIETGVDSGGPFLLVRTNRGRALKMAADLDAIFETLSDDASWDRAEVSACGLQIEECE